MIVWVLIGLVLLVFNKTYVYFGWAESYQLNFNQIAVMYIRNSRFTK